MPTTRDDSAEWGRFPPMSWLEVCAHLHEFLHKRVQVSVRAMDGQVPILDVFGRLTGGPLGEFERAEIITLNITTMDGDPGLYSVVTLSEGHLAGGSRLPGHAALHLETEGGVQLSFILLPDIP